VNQSQKSICSSYPKETVSLASDNLD